MACDLGLGFLQVIWLIRRIDSTARMFAIRACLEAEGPGHVEGLRPPHSCRRGRASHIVAIATLLKDDGANVTTANDVATALTYVENLIDLDCAILDIRLGNDDVMPVADALATLGVPFVFLTSYTQHPVLTRHRDRPVIAKPCRIEGVLDALDRAIW